MHNINSIITELEEVLKSRGDRSGASVDLCHGVFLLGAILSAKPQNVLELGIGPAFASEILCAGIKYNGTGQLTCVDNFLDLGGNLPKEKVDYLQSNGVKIVAPVDEKDFIISCKDDTYDFLVSDADHCGQHDWAQKVFDIMKDGSIMFFHDVNDFPALRVYERLAQQHGYFIHTFDKSSRSDERCHRGWQMIIKSNGHR